jgi:Do/DeqQ family serine protease
MKRENIILVFAASITTAAAIMGASALGQLAGPQSAANPVEIAQLEQALSQAPADRAVPGSRTEMQQSFAPVVRRTAPAVVNVYSSVLVRRAGCPYANDPFWGPRMCGGRPAEAEQKRVENSLGSGVIVGSDGVIVTNYHVIAEGDQFRIVLNDRREFPATIVMKDERTDLAVLKVDTKGQKLPTLDYADTRGVQVGDLVLAIGNPFGVGQSVSSGIVSALARTDVNVQDISSFIQTDASINPGNSGGALVDMNGRLVGVNSMIFSKGGGSNGIGFAIPAEMVRRVVDAAVHGGTLVRPWLGAGGDPVDSKMAATLGLDSPRGVQITSIYPGSPAEKAGVRKGDVILSIDGREVYDDKGMKFIAATKAEGETLNLSVLRSGQEKLLQAKLTAPPGTAKAELIQINGRNPFTGAQVAELSPALADELGLDPVKYESGMLVYAVPSYTIAQRVGFQTGDIVKEINGVSVKTRKDLDAALKKADSEGQWRMAIERNGERIEKTIQ